MLHIYTDGSAQPNPGPGGAGAIVVKDGKIIDKICYSEDSFPTTTNIMELTAVILAYSYLHEQEQDAIIYTDSQYV